MLRKTCLAHAISLLLTSPAFAGFYIGAGLGGDYAQFTQKSHVYDTYGDFDVIDEENFSGSGVFGTFFGGYSWVHNWFYFAGEANFNPSSLQYRLINRDYVHYNFAKSSFSIHYSEGVSALPGVVVADKAVIYGRIGYANGHVELHNSDPTVKSKVSNRNGIRYGAGMRYSLNEQWSLMADFSQTNYQKYRSIVSMGGVVKNSRLYPVSSQFAFGLIYNFEKPKVFVK